MHDIQAENENGPGQRWPIIEIAAIAAVLALSVLVADVAVPLALALITLTAPGSRLAAPRATTRNVGATLRIVALIAVAIDLVDFGLGLNSAWIRIPVLLIGIGFVLFYLIGLVNRFKDISVRNKLILGFLFVTSVSLGAVGFVNNLILQREISDQLQITMQSIASEEASGIGDLLVSELNLLQVLSTNNLLQISSVAATINNSYSQADIAELDSLWRAADAANNDSDPFVSSVLSSPVSDELRVFRESFPAHVELFVTDRSGINIAATNRTSDYYQADEDWWQAAFAQGAGAVFIGQPEFDDSSDTLAVNMAMPIWSPNQDQIVGILRTTVDISILNEILGSVAIGQTGGVDLRLPNDTMISPVGEQRIQELSPTTIQAFALMGDFYGEIDYQGHEALVALQPVSSTSVEDAALLESLGWFVVAHQARAEALQAVQAATRTTVLVVALALLAAGALAGLFAQLLTRPIVELTDAAERLQQGDFTAQAQIMSGDEIGTLAATFNDMTVQIQDLVSSLEDRVADRTRALAISAQISRQLSTILEEKRLVREVVEQVKQAFDYYHVQIYMWDSDRYHLNLAAGTGNAGQLLLESTHQIPLGTGLVGWAADTNTVMIAEDTVADPHWMPNPLLPKTRSEVAIPIALADQVLGVLDVQHVQPSGLTAADVDVLVSIANQVAVALQNANTYVVTQEEAQRKSLINDINRKIHSTQSVEDALRVAVREIGRIAGAKRTQVQLGTQPSNSGLD
jgi:putative methionine-R-sulfoxide reductase with GAF domain